MGSIGMRGPKGVKGYENPTHWQMFTSSIIIKVYRYQWKLICFLCRFIPYFERWK